MQLQSMSLRARRVIVRLGASAVVFYSTNRRVRTRTSARKGLLAYVTFGPQIERDCERTTGERRLDARGSARFGGHLRSRRRLREHYVSAFARRDPCASHGPPARKRVSCAARRGDRCRSTAIVLGSCSSGASDWWILPHGNRHCSTSGRRNGSRPTSSWSRLLLAILGGAHDFEPSRSDRTRQAQSLIVKIAEEYALVAVR